MERAERIIMAIRTQLHWARSAVVALAIGVLLMVFNQRKMYMSAVGTSGGFGEASADSTFKFERVVDHRVEDVGSDGDCCALCGDCEFVLTRWR